MSAILIAEDEQRISSFVAKGLRSAGFQTTAVVDGRDALIHAQSGRYDLVLLDVGLPGLDGFQVLERLRSTDVELPVIMLTARTSTADTVTGLTGGADDYIPKPFRFDELLARVQLRLRRRDPATPSIISYGGLTLDLRKRHALVDGRPVELSAREFALTEEFLRHPDQILSREDLLRRVWGLDFDPGSNVVDVYIRYLRAKLGADRIETVRGTGYRLV